MVRQQVNKKTQGKQAKEWRTYLLAKKNPIRVLLTCAFCFRQRRVVAIIKGLYGVFSGTPCVGSFNKKQKQLLSNKKKKRTYFVSKASGTLAQRQ